MKTKVKSQKLKVKSTILRLFRLSSLVFCLYLTACVTGSMPNLEEPQCTESREITKKFYSFHFGNEMKFSSENLKLRENFLTPEYYKSLQILQTENDVFTTNNTDFPKAFKLAECKVIEPTKTTIEILLFWKDDNRNEQKSITAEVIKKDDKWLINKVLN